MPVTCKETSYNAHFAGSGVAAFTSTSAKRRHRARRAAAARGHLQGAHLRSLLQPEPTERTTVRNAKQRNFEYHVKWIRSRVKSIEARLDTETPSAPDACTPADVLLDARAVREDLASLHASVREMRERDGELREAMVVLTEMLRGVHEMAVQTQRLVVAACAHPQYGADTAHETAGETLAADEAMIVEPDASIVLVPADESLTAEPGAGAAREPTSMTEGRSSGCFFGLSNIERRPACLDSCYRIQFNRDDEGAVIDLRADADWLPLPSRRPDYRLCIDDCGITRTGAAPVRPLRCQCGHVYTVEFPAARLPLDGDGIFIMCRSSRTVLNDDLSKRAHTCGCGSFCDKCISRDVI